MTVTTWLTVKAAVFCTKLKQFAVSLHRRTENKHTGVEAVRPAGVGSSWQLLSVKQLIYIWKHLGSRKQTNGQTCTHTRVVTVCLAKQTCVSPVCLRPWKHIWSNAWESSSGVWWRWRPGRASSSWPGAPRRRCPSRPPPSPRRRSSSARTWRFTMLKNESPSTVQLGNKTIKRCDSEMFNCCLEARYLTGKLPTHVDRWVPPASWMYCGCGGTCPEPWLPERSCHWWPTSQKPGLQRRETHRGLKLTTSIWWVHFLTLDLYKL